MPRNVFLIGPFMVRCGYGGTGHGREVIEAVEGFDKVKIFAELRAWGNCGWMFEDNDYRRKIIECARNLDVWRNSQPPRPNIVFSMQLGVPPEFSRPLPCPHVGITAGIEADKIHHDWIMKINKEVDLLIVPSTFVKRTFDETKFVMENSYSGEKSDLKMEKPVVVIPETVDTDTFNEKIDCNLDLNFDTDFNFISVGQWQLNNNLGEDRKNIPLMVKWFKELFKGNKNVGLILKVNGVNNSLLDREAVKIRLSELIRVFNLSEYPKVYLVHQYLTEQQMAQLYRHPKVKAYLTITHGEGYGRPIQEAAACDLPVIAPNWSGHKEFLDLGKWVKLETNMVNVPQCHIGTLFEQGSRWCDVPEDEFKKKVNKIVVNYSTPKEWAVDLGKKVRANFCKDVVYKKWKDIVEPIIPKEKEDLSQQVQEFD